MVESHARTLLKTVTYRVVGAMLTITIAWIITRRVGTAVAVGGADALVRLVAYYAHERLWDRIKFGRRPWPPDYNI